MAGGINSAKFPQYYGYLEASDGLVRSLVVFITLLFISCPAFSVEDCSGALTGLTKTSVAVESIYPDAQAMILLDSGGNELAVVHVVQGQYPSSPSTLVRYGYNFKDLDFSIRVKVNEQGYISSFVIYDLPLGLY